MTVVEGANSREGYFIDVFYPNAPDGTPYVDIMLPIAQSMSVVSNCDFNTLTHINGAAGPIFNIPTSCDLTVTLFFEGTISAFSAFFLYHCTFSQ